MEARCYNVGLAKLPGRTLFLFSTLASLFPRSANANIICESNVGLVNADVSFNYFVHFTGFRHNIFRRCGTVRELCATIHALRIHLSTVENCLAKQQAWRFHSFRSHMVHYLRVVQGEISLLRRSSLRK